MTLHHKIQEAEDELSKAADVLAQICGRASKAEWAEALSRYKTLKEMADEAHRVYGEGK